MDTVDTTDAEFIRIDLSTIALDGEQDEEAAVVTGRFARLSAPYLCIEIERAREPLGRSRSTTYARTVPMQTIGFDPKWYDVTEAALLAIEEPAPVIQKQSWWWLAISLAVAGVVVATICAG